MHQPLRLPGQVVQDGSTLYYNVFRHYRSAWARYVSSDPIGIAGGMNMFAYVNDRPLQWRDPFGLFCTKDFVAQYLSGLGTPIDLERVGLLKRFVGTRDVQGAMEGERSGMFNDSQDKARQACKGCNKGVKSAFIEYDRRDIDGKGIYVQTYDQADCLFSLGASRLEASNRCWVSANCATKTFTSHCATSWSLLDHFSDPLSLRETVFGPVDFSVPYDIVAHWMDMFDVRGQF